MAPSVVQLLNDNTLIDNVVLTPSTAPVAYNGSGTPWTDAATTPFEIANNDVTGDRWVITSPQPEPAQDGAPPFAVRQQTIDLLYRNRIVTIPIQMRATSEANLVVLPRILRTIISASVTDETTVLSVEYGGETVLMNVENGVFQEDYRFWNDENGLYVMRGVLTLQCSIGYTANSGFTSLGTVANGSAAYSMASVVGGDTPASIGQPASIILSFGSTAIRTFWLASTAALNTNTHSESLVTSSTSGVTSTNSLIFSLQSYRRATRYRFLCVVTSPNTHLQVRAEIVLDGGATIYTGPWISVGTSTTIVDLGFVSLSQAARSYYSSGRMRIGYRSSSGSATAGTLARLIAMEYFTFCKIETTISEDVYRFTSQMAFIPGDSGAPIVDTALVQAGAPPVPIEQPAVQGRLPRVFVGASLWAAWLDGGVYNSAATGSGSVNATRLYHTISAGL